jgi:hypothetical protein
MGHSVAAIGLRRARHEIRRAKSGDRTNIRQRRENGAAAVRLQGECAGALTLRGSKFSLFPAAESSAPRAGAARILK